MNTSRLPTQCRCHHQVMHRQCPPFARPSPRHLLISPCPAVGFEAPSTAQIASLATITISSVATGAYWWLVVVPSERAALSKEKRRGAVKDYLEELEQDPSRKAERWFYTEWREKLQRRKQLNAWGNTPTPSTDATGASTTSTATEMEVASTSTSASLPHSSSSGQAHTEGPMGAEQRQPTDQPSPNLLKPTYYTPEPKFWSLDNPVVFVFAVLGVLVLITSLITGGKTA